jgi:hypothetical protein
MTKILFKSTEYLNEADIEESSYLKNIQQQPSVDLQTALSDVGLEQQNLKGEGLNLFSSFGDKNIKDNEETLQNRWIKEEVVQTKLVGAADGRKPGLYPNYMLPTDGQRNYTQSAKPDITCLHVPMFLELKKSKQDSKLHDSTQLIIRRLRSLVSMNCLIRRAFGFAVNGGPKSVFVSFERKLSPNVGEVKYLDSYRLEVVNTVDIPDIWATICEAAKRDERYFLHEDASQVSKALGHILGFNVFPYAKVSLVGRSASRVYALYLPKLDPEATKLQDNLIIGRDDSAAFTLKVSDNRNLSLNEYKALKRISEKMEEEDLQNFYVHDLLLFDGTRFVNHSPPLRFSNIDKTHILSKEDFLKHSLTEEVLENFKVYKSINFRDIWWNKVHDRDNLGNFVVLVMKMGTGIRYADMNNSKLGELFDVVSWWLSKLNPIVFHTDLRRSNIMIFPVVKATSNNEYAILNSIERKMQGLTVTTGAERKLDFDSELKWTAIPIDYDYAVLKPGNGRCTIDISQSGARRDLIIEIQRLPSTGVHNTVEWTGREESIMARKTIFC